jgi:hypothetical protein
MRRRVHVQGSSGSACYAGFVNVDPHEERAELLLELFRLTETTPRRRDPSEAPLELTQAYVRLLYAVGFARLSRPDLALALRNDGIATLREKDRLHSVLRGLLRARLDQALRAGAVAVRWDDDARVMLRDLDEEQRGKLDRLRSASWIIDPQGEDEPLARAIRLRRTEGDEPEARRLAEEALRGATPEGFNVLRRAVCKAVLGQTAEALGLAALAAEPRSRLTDVRLAALTLGLLPPREAGPGLRDLIRERWPAATDMSATNSHVNVAAFTIIDAAVVAVSATPPALETLPVVADALVERGHLRGALLSLALRRRAENDEARLRVLDEEEARIAAQSLPHARRELGL